MRARVLALDRDAKAPAPAGHRAIGTGRRQRLDDGLDDLLPAMIGRQGHRRPRVGPHHRARLGDNRDRPKSAVVFRGMRVDQIGQRDDDRGVHVGVGRVDKARHLLVRVREVDCQIAAALCDRGANIDVVIAAPVIVEHCFPVINAVLPPGDDRAGLALGAVEHRLDRRIRDRPAEFAGERQKAALPDMRRPDHRREVAAKIPRVADIGRDHLRRSRRGSPRS